MATSRSILFLCDDPDTLGGLQRVLAVLADEFARRGYRVVITSLVGSEQRGFVDASIERVTLFRRGWVTRLLQWPKLGPLHLRGRRVIRLQPQRAARRQLREQVRTLQPDAVIVFDSLMAKIVAEARLDDAKVLVQYHNSFVSIEGTNDLLRLRKASHAVSGFLALNEDDAKSFATAGFVRVDYMPNPVSFYPASLPEHRKQRIVALGRYHYQKAFDHLVIAWAKVERKEGWSLDIYGEGPDRPLIESTVREYGVTDSVSVHLPTWQAEAVLMDASIYALSSRFEGFGMVIAEAMACGVPVVSTRCGPGPESLVEGCGLLSDIGDTDGLAANLQLLIDHPEEREAFAVVGRSKVQNYRVDRIVDRWEAFIAETSALSG